jgi:hypothetical protein
MDTCNGMKLSRRTGIAALLLLAAPAMLLAAAPPDLTGEWQGKLAVTATNSLTVRFTFTKGANGAYTAVLNSPDNSAVKNTPVSGVTWDGTNLKLSVPTLQGSYAGKLANGTIAGEWTQPGSKLPLQLAPFQKTVLTSDAMKPYVGEWNSTLTLAANSQKVMFTFKQGAGGLDGTFEIPDQGVKRPMTDVTVENGELSLKVNVGAEISFKGKLVGNRIVGKLKVPSPVAPPDGADMTFERGAYKPPPVALKLTAADFAVLKGSWKGKGSVTVPQNNQKVDFDMTLRFESNAKGEYFGYLDSTARGVTSTGVIVNEATFAAGKLTIKVATAQMEYSGTVAGKKITGEFVQGGLRTPLELTQTP